MGYVLREVTEELIDEIRLLRRNKSRVVKTFKGHSNWVRSVALSPDGKVWASGLRNGKIKLWDVEKREEISTLEGHGGSVYSVTFSPGGKCWHQGLRMEQLSCGISMIKKTKKP